MKNIFVAIIAIVLIMSACKKQEEVKEAVNNENPFLQNGLLHLEFHRLI